MLQCDVLADELQSQLSDAFTLQPGVDGCVVHTPFLYPDNTHITLYITHTSSGQIEISDDGYAHSYAWLSGVSRKFLERTIADVGRRFSTNAENGEIVLTADLPELVQAIVNAIGASQGIADTVIQRRTLTSKSMFRREIETSLVVHNRVYETNAWMQGATKAVQVDYKVLPSETAHQIALFGVPHEASLRYAESIAFRAGNLLSASTPIHEFSRLVIMLEDHPVSAESGRWAEVVKTIRGTRADVINWSDKERVSELLAA